MYTNKTRKQEEAEDIFFGQIVIIWARWFVIAAGVILALWLSTDATQLTISILLLTIIIGINFFVHGRYLMEKPINQTLLLTLSAIDLSMITAILLIGPGQSGLASYMFIFYYPLLAAFAFVFPPNFTIIYTAATLMVYALVCFIVDLGIIRSSSDMEVLAMRLITMAAMGGLGAYYWRSQRARREAVISSKLQVTSSK